MDDMRMIVGLGNPGDEYADTRHNTGFKVIDSLAETVGVKVKKRKFGARFEAGEFAGKKLILLKPWQYMNRSGQAVATAAGFYKINIRNLMVVTDDMDLEPGRIRLRYKGSAGGHNGLADIIQKLGMSEFARCRVGIGRSAEVDTVGYVLDKPQDDEKPLLTEAIERARNAVLCWIEYGIETAMNKFNSYSE
ncbi:MAG: aminoacyl-tRNA hydrolase [Sedimentisphaerales bacterium]|nr:aminoacyl-tRNA hydrolase [Sedimentisphaerales bacterium]